MLNLRRMCGGTAGAVVEPPAAALAAAALAADAAADDARRPPGEEAAELGRHRERSASSDPTEAVLPTKLAARRGGCGDTAADEDAVSYTHLTLPTTPYV